jgi:basic amino acid/polyamine antiporter, APA family
MTSAVVFFQLSSLLDWNFSYILWSYPWGGALTLADLCAVIIILLFSISNSISIRFSGNLQVLLTFIPVTLVLCLCIYGLFTFEPQSLSPESMPVNESRFDFVKAYLLVYFAYAGWNAVVYFSGDFENPRRDVPFSLLLGTGATTLIYFILGSAFVFILGFTGLQSVPEAGTAIAGVLGGPKAQLVMTGLIAAAILASINGTVLAGGKIGYAMARDGTLGFRLAENHNTNAWQNILFGVQALWSILLVLTGGFEALTELTSLAMLVTAGLSMIALFVIRKKTEIQTQLYRFKGFMLAPWIFFIVNLGILVVSIRTALVKMHIEDENSWKAWYSLLGIILFVALWLSHLAWTRIKNKSIEHPTSS